MVLGAPQIIYLALVLLGLGSHLAKHGEKKEGKYDFWSSLIAQGIIIWILAAGGFFS